jgi:multidrug efflux pump subunit AcrB
VLVIGMVVDNSIIFSEAIAAHRAGGLPPLDAAVLGVRENLLPVATTVTTTIAAFVPLLFVRGVVGQFVSVIPLVVTAALLLSLAESVAGLPAHLAAGAGRRAGGGAVRGWFTAARDAFETLADRLLRLRYLLVPAFALVAAAAVWYAAGRMSFVLFPTKGAERFFVNMELAMGSSLSATSDKVKQVERIVASLPPGEVENTLTRIGTAGYPPFGQAGNYAMIIVRLVPYSRRARSADQIVEDLRQRTDRLPGYVRIAYDIDAGGVPVGQPIALRVTGNDDAMRAGLARRLQTLLAATPGVKDVRSDDIRGKDQLTVEPDRRALARLGLNAAAVAAAVRAAWDGTVATSLREGDEDVGFRVLLDPRSRGDERALKGLLIANEQGRLVRLGDAARLEERPAPSAWRHQDGRRTITVAADVDTEVTTPLRAVEHVLAQIDLAREWPGMTIAAAGEAEQSLASLQGLLSAFCLAVLGIYFVLVLQLDSFVQPLLVLVTVPFGVVGVIVALALHGEPLGFLAIVGAIGLAGVVVNDAIVLVSHLNNLRRDHPAASSAEIRALVAAGTADRLRAVVLTTVTTTAGMIPLAWGLGGYDLYMAPMALSLGYGLLLATPLTLLLLPALYLIGMDARLLLRRRTAAAVGGRA